MYGMLWWFNGKGKTDRYSLEICCNEAVSYFEKKYGKDLLEIVLISTKEKTLIEESFYVLGDLKIIRSNDVGEGCLFLCVKSEYENIDLRLFGK